jgi:hypothetical protein
MAPEPFVSAEHAAQFLDIPRRHLLALARRGIAGAYPLDPSSTRRTWVFRLSELSAAIAGRNPLLAANDNHPPASDQDRMRSAVSRA